MPVIKSRIDKSSAEFKENAAANQALVADLRAKVAAIKEGGEPQARERHVARGKLLPRDRIHGLLDPGAPFLELSQLAAYQVYDEDVPAAGIITGIGRIAGLECMVVANDATEIGRAHV